MPEKSQVAVLGYSLSLKVCKALGLECYPVTAAAEGGRQLEKISAAGNCHLVMVLGQLAADIKNDIDRINTGSEINILVLPDEISGAGLGLTALEEKVKKAIGIKLREFEETK